jgi:hypothetical protein
MAQNTLPDKNHISSPVLTALRSGQTIGCEIPAKLPNHVAWVEVDVRLDKSKGVLTRKTPDRRLQVVWKTDEDPIIGYRIRHVELDKQYRQYIFDVDLYASVDEETLVSTTDELECALAEFVDDFTSLEVFPDIVDLMKEGEKKKVNKGG